MVTRPIELFFSYAHEDKNLRARIDKHLSMLVQEGLIAQWYDEEIMPGSVWNDEIRKHLEQSQIILLLVSADFLASKYIWDVEIKEALKRHEAGTARVLPIILHPCDWESAPFAEIQVLPAGAKAVTLWTNRNAAFTSIAKGIRKVVNELHGTDEPKPKETTRRKSQTGGGEVGGDAMAKTPTTINDAFLRRAIKQYSDDLKRYQESGNYEQNLRAAFQNLLDGLSKHVGWLYASEVTVDKNRYDGVILDEFKIRRGYWEAKGPGTNLEDEIRKKIARKYPLTNIIFEDSQTAILYQNKRRVPFNFDLSKPNDVSDLLRQFFTYVEPDIAQFEEAVEEFKERIPEHAQALLNIIKEEHKLNRKFQTSFATFAEICRSSLDPKMSDANIDEMLVQHLLTERLFRTVFNNSDFVRRNVIAAEIEKVIDALASRSFNRNDFLQILDRFYVAIEKAAKGRDSWSERQDFLNTVYERFFQGFSVKQADTFGIVYTPQEIVDFMVESVDEVLKKEFGKSIETPGVKILDPATGTGNFIVNIINRIDDFYLEKKYKEDLFCNEIMLLPYYISSLNIEHEYYARMGQYESFEGICFADTLELTEGQQLSLFVEENTERVQHEKDADIMVVMGNPPYNMGQKNENDNNKNRPYPTVDKRINETYVKSSNAKLNNKLYDAYVRFFRWATDRLRGPGIVCLVSNNSFIDQFAFDGMRKRLMDEFDIVYHLDLHGNIRKNPKLSGTTHNIFGIQVGVGITIAIKLPNSLEKKTYYYRVPEFATGKEKFAFLEEKKNISNLDWLELQPDSNYTWITDGLHTEFKSFLPIGTTETKDAKGLYEDSVFRLYSLGVATNRDDWAYDFDKLKLDEKMRRFILNYNGEVFRWSQENIPSNILINREETLKYVSNFVNSNPGFVKWTDRLKEALYKKLMLKFDPEEIRRAAYRPFCTKFLYFDPLLNQRRYQQYLIFPTPSVENVVIWIKTGSEWPMFALMTDAIPDLLPQGGSQCFPFYTYSKDGSNRQENITDWALKQFQEKYSSQITKWDVFHYVYGMLHHPQYRVLYKENLKRDLPHVPLLLKQEDFEACVSVGKQLMDIHINYEQAEEYPLKHRSDKTIPYNQRLRVEKMRLSGDKTYLLFSKGLTLEGIPQACFEYRLGNRSALEWVIDQYQVSTDKRSGIESDPNRLDDPEYILRLVKQVITVSVKTVELVKELAEAVTSEDWLGAQIAVSEEVSLSD